MKGNGPTKYRSCKVKKKYSEEEAKRVAIAVNLANNKHWTVENVIAYRCRFCQFWHVGHETRPEKTGRKKDRPNQKKIKKLR